MPPPPFGARYINQQREYHFTLNDERINALTDLYRALISKEKNVIFGGRMSKHK